MVTQVSSKKIVVSGMRATGRLHLGHYQGVIKNWLALQKESQCYFFAADLHALTTHYENPLEIRSNTTDMVIDWLACGLDPSSAVIFIQSQVPQHAELHLLLSMSTPLSWLERVPTYKEQMLKLKEKNINTYGFLGYPVLMSADILLYQANSVPVGEDQVPHLEITREIARRFNHFYGDILPEPQALLATASKMPGLDGQKMSKSYGNTITLRDTDEEINQKIKTMPTDPARIRRADPGDPKRCPVWGLHKIYSSVETQNWVQEGCQSAGIGCLECKKPLIERLCTEVGPIREKANQLCKDPEKLKTILAEGAAKARKAADSTMTTIKNAMGLYNE